MEAEEATEEIPQQTLTEGTALTEAEEATAMGPLTVPLASPMLTAEEEAEELIMVTEEGTEGLPEAEAGPAQFALAASAMEPAGRYILLG